MIAIKRKDGGVSILHDGNYIPELIDEIVKKWREAQMVRNGDDNYVSHSECAALPDDRYFRSAWVLDGDNVVVGMDQARQVLRDKMRVARAPLLADLDIQQMRGVDVEAQKNALRDVTSNPSIETAATPDELKSTWPTDLLNGLK